MQTPHLVNLNEDPLMSECLLYYIKEGTTRSVYSSRSCNAGSYMYECVCTYMCVVCVVCVCVCVLCVLYLGLVVQERYS